VAAERRRREVGPRPFRSNVPDKADLGFEIFKLSDLHERAARGLLLDPLDAPGRLAFHLLFVGTRGAGEHVVDFDRCPLGAGFLTVASRGRVHQFVVDRGVDAWMILFSPELVDRDSRVLAPSLTPPALALPADEQAWMSSLCERMQREFARAPDAVQAPLLVSLVRVLLLGAERLLGEAERRRGRAAPPTALQRFLAAVERDFARTRSVAHYARAAGVSPRRLAELLDEQGHPTAKQVVCERVALEQKRLLAHGDASVKEIAALTGFEDATNCVKFFRRLVGATPLEFRARVRR
jgi:AraC-like DNA-binding protein